MAASLAGLFAFGDPTFTSVAAGGISTVVVALASALTMIPALLATCGPKLKAARRQQARTGSSAGWPAGCSTGHGRPQAG